MVEGLRLMGIRMVPHSDMCGCERCAKAYKCDVPYQVYDLVEDPNILDCGCDRFDGCRCYDDEGPDDYLEHF